MATDTLKFKDFPTGFKNVVIIYFFMLYLMLPKQ